MPKPNYSFEKRQRELAKKKKKAEKDARKRQARDATSDTGPAASPPSAGNEPAPAPGQASGPPDAPRTHLRKPH